MGACCGGWAWVGVWLGFGFELGLGCGLVLGCWCCSWVLRGGLEIAGGLIGKGDGLEVDGQWGR